jgi:biopolymer transport protein ExbD
MAMSVGSSSSDGVMVDMNLTPLIDVMLVLLTLFMITLPIQTHAVKLDMPRPNPNQPLIKPIIVDLGIDFDGTITWNNTPVDRATLQAYFKQAADQGDTQPEIHLAPNRLAKYDIVAKVLADAQRLNVKKIGFTGLDQYRQ